MFPSAFQRKGVQVDKVQTDQTYYASEHSQDVYRPLQWMIYIAEK